jgi:hypothetical protein
MLTRKTWFLPVLIAPTLLFAGSMGASGQVPDPLIRQNRQADIDILNSIQNRERFQLEQRLQRELDRNMLGQREPRPEVREFIPSCREPTTGGGNRPSRGCR